jgi:DNA invertase Pin-like site-specific DNA recombinase
MHVLHTCDNPSCVCPQHLFLGTNLDNIADKVAKGRQRGGGGGLRGEKHGQAKLTERDVIAIRASVGATLQEIADLYGISNQQVSRIRARKKWAHVA